MILRVFKVDELRIDLYCGHKGRLFHSTHVNSNSLIQPRASIVTNDANPTETELEVPDSNDAAATDNAPRDEEQYVQSRELAVKCARIADDYRGLDTVILDLTKVTPIVDFFVITTGSSRRQMNAIADEVNRMMKSVGPPPLSIEGHRSSDWVLHDYGDILMHVFTDEARNRYRLEQLWADGERIEWKVEEAT